MKIAVLFGSFNPLTNAHIDAMTTAVNFLKADKGLFVATNGKYLRKKGVKLNDAFYLTEDERKEIISKTCANYEKLEFWGFELGGINPKRYKTLCKIQAQYPDAELFEIQGADKVRSIPKFGDAEDYLKNIKFAVFERDNINLDKLIEDTPILYKYKSSFQLLPALCETGAVSSTEVRRRFYANEDYCDIIPPAATEALRRHTPSDFEISYTDRMKTIIQSGRFGVNNAQKIVYSENTALFNRWKNGNNEIELGDYNQFLDNTVLYDSGFSVADIGTVYPATVTGCCNADCVCLAQHLINNGYNPAILNLASARRAGGGYAEGLSAQEESLCRSSNLSLSLYQFTNHAKLKCARESGVPARKIGYPLDLNYGGIYTPNVTFFRNNKSELYTIKDNPFKCDVITVAALSFRDRANSYAQSTELIYRAADGGFTPDGEEIMLNKIRTIFRLGVQHGKDSIILGVFGCGAYRLPAKDVAKLFTRVINEPEFKNKFRLLVFAILENGNNPTGREGKFADFYNEFGTYMF